MDRLSAVELKEATKPLLIPGDPYLFIQTQGWAVVGHYVCHESPFSIRLTNMSHFRNAGVDYGKLATQGPAANCEWRYEGEGVLNANQVIRIVQYNGKVHRSKIRGA